jgi:hypothetical protein
LWQLKKRAEIPAKSAAGIRHGPRWTPSTAIIRQVFEQRFSAGAMARQ